MTKIPAEVRREILSTDMIGLAIPKPENEAMYHLFVYYKNYLNPDQSMECPKCWGKVLDDWKSFLPALIELERESNLLKNA